MLILPSINLMKVKIRTSSTPLVDRLFLGKKPWAAAGFKDTELGAE